MYLNMLGGHLLLWKEVLGLEWLRTEEREADLGSTMGSKNVRPDCSLLIPGWVENISTQQWEVPLDYYFF